MGLLVLFCLCLGCVGSSFGEKLYGAYDFGSGMVVAQYDSECSTTKNVSYFPDLFFAVGNKCAFDQDKGIMYSYAENSTAQKKFIYGISLTTGEILSTTSPPGNNLRAPQMAFDSNSGKIIFTADDSNGFWQQYLVNPRTGRGQNVNSVNGTNYSPFLGAGSGFDPVNSIQWIPAADLTMGTSNQLGLGLDGSIYLVLDQNSGSTPVYSGDSAGTMYAWGYTGKRVTQKWSLSDNQTIFVAQVKSSWLQDDSGVSVYVPETNTMYGILDNGDPDVDYFLVGVDVNTGATKSAVFLNEAVWPWCLGYVNDV
mmetsp:Transcript_5739/g.7472  ORF Transcript_5739/g.7472 Transcript_5739/m.7472 type:complete len:310 (+) Transcript_5739:39-968(+)